ncbi:transcriptional regulator with XRE-family HTH domain [Leucobacter exalbidus]|uniref:Transcriptional regulator with XRE-family HTH domain n=2 Tax=Leucobacter exalbidus TaxID=662960 RepID=A0A940T4L4_9MICO|nr:transcriptional regulator with XRE-family HTH domain [Leucobacter exalbidus]
MSQAELAQKLSVHYDIKLDASAVARIERGERGVKLDEAVGIAQILDTELEALLDSATSIDRALRRQRTELALAKVKLAAMQDEVTELALNVENLEQEIADREVRDELADDLRTEQWPG